MPGVAPRVQLPTVAIPAESVTAVAPVMEPPPEATAKVTTTPGTGLHSGHVTFTLGGVLTAVPTVADWLSPAFAAMVGSNTMIVSTLETLSELGSIATLWLASATKKRNGPLPDGMTLPAGSL